MVEKKGSVFQEWNADVRQPYVLLLNKMVMEIRNIPRFMNSIHMSDIRKLRELAKAWDIEIEIDDEELMDPDVFEEVKGEIEREMKKVLEEKLKPEDPILKHIEKFQLQEKELRDLLQREEEEYEAI